MVDYTLRFGERNKSNNQYPTINIQGLSNTSSSKTNWGEVAGGVAGLGIGILGSVFAAKNMSGGSAKDVNLTPEQVAAREQNQIINSISSQYNLEGIDNQIKSIEDSISKIDIEIAKENSYKNIEATEAYKKNEQAIKDAETKYGFGAGEVKGDVAEKGRAYQKAKDSLTRLENQSSAEQTQIATYEAHVGQDGAGGGSLDTAISNLDSEITNLKQNLSQYNDSDDEQMQNEKYMLQEKIKAKETEKLNLEAQRNEEKNKLQQLKTKHVETEAAIKGLKEETNGILNAGSSDEIKQAYTNYQSLLSERDRLNGLQVGAETKIKELNDKKADLLAQKVYFQNARVIEVEQTEQGIKKNKIGKDYTEADAKDGNWWSRTWQKTKGIFNKQERLEYQQMKEAHEAKDAAVDAMKALGGSKSDLKAMQNDSVTVSVEKFFNGKQKIDGIEDDIADAIRTGGTAAAENVYNKKLEDLAEKKADDAIDDITKKIQQSTILSDEQKKTAIETTKDGKDLITKDIKSNINSDFDTEQYIKNIENFYKPRTINK